MIARIGGHRPHPGRSAQRSRKAAMRCCWMMARSSARQRKSNGPGQIDPRALVMRIAGTKREKPVGARTSGAGSWRRGDRRQPGRGRAGLQSPAGRVESGRPRSWASIACRPAKGSACRHLPSAAAVREKAAWTDLSRRCTDRFADRAYARAAAGRHILRMELRPALCSCNRASRPRNVEISLCAIRGRIRVRRARPGCGAGGAREQAPLRQSPARFADLRWPAFAANCGPGTFGSVPVRGRSRASVGGGSCSRMRSRRTADLRPHRCRCGAEPPHERHRDGTSHGAFALRRTAL
jgi:hypothetical protein